jgi:hypothetical protein
MTDRLNPYDDLSAIGQITSQDSSSTLVLQGDRNLVLYRSTGIARWATSTHHAVSAVMHGDGNFIL